MPARARLFPIDPLQSVRAGLVRQVRRVFNDEARGEVPVQLSDNALFPRGSVIWRVHADVAAMMVGGIAALLVQMLHPLALAGVLGHSDFRQDMLGRLRRTARFIAVTTYGDRADAEVAIGRVRGIHARVRGTAADGRPYAADDPRLLAWIHVAEALCFLAAYVRYVDPDMNAADADRYFAEFAVIARKLGADPVPVTLAEARALLEDFRPELAANAETHEVARIILQGGRANPAAASVHATLAEAAVGIVPPWARAMLGLSGRGLRQAPARLATQAMAATLRWAFAPGSYRR